MIARGYDSRLFPKAEAGTGKWLLYGGVVVVCECGTVVPSKSKQPTQSIRLIILMLICGDADVHAGHISSMCYCSYSAAEWLGSLIAGGFVIAFIMGIYQCSYCCNNLDSKNSQNQICP